MSKNELRSSQVITTFGPGAMIDLPDVSVIVAGLDHWRYDKSRLPTIQEPRLTAKLREITGVNDLTLRQPPPERDQDFGPKSEIVAWRFPEWLIVQKTQITKAGYRRRRLVHLDHLENGKFRDADRKRHPVVPVRFVRACTRGHIGDIDWIAFVHGIGNSCPRDLWMEERGTSGDLDEVWVVCDCGKDRAMSQAARRQLRALGSCDGSRPWLGRGTKEPCGKENRLLIRSASNAYFPQLLSVISIPDARGPIDDVVRSLWDNFLIDVETVEDLLKIRRKPMVASALQNIDDDDVFAAIQRARVGQKEERGIKEVEFEALSEAREELGSDVPEGNFFARTLLKAQWDAPWMKGIHRIVLVHRLREVVAQVGFTRFESAGPDIEGELDINVERAPLALDLPWLPAVENRGEGIFILFDATHMEKWRERPEVVKRERILREGFNRWKAEHAEVERTFPGASYYLLHSLSHLLLTSISLECGYPAASLRERVYSAPGRNGILIYTGSSDAEGTLGGLVQAGRDIRRFVQLALEHGKLCSNDPICAYHSPVHQDHQELLGSACHGCLLIAETSCEQHNVFLDRSLVVQTIDSSGAEFF